MKHISEDLAKILQQQDEATSSVKIDLTSEGVLINIFDRSHKPIFESNSDVFALTAPGFFNLRLGNFALHHVQTR